MCDCVCFMCAFGQTCDCRITPVIMRVSIHYSRKSSVKGERRKGWGLWCIAHVLQSEQLHHECVCMLVMSVVCVSQARSKINFLTALPRFPVDEKNGYCFFVSHVKLKVALVSSLWNAFYIICWNSLGTPGPSSRCAWLQQRRDTPVKQRQTQVRERVTEKTASNRCQSEHVHVFEVKFWREGRSEGVGCIDFIFFKVACSC